MELRITIQVVNDAQGRNENENENEQRTDKKTNYAIVCTNCGSWFYACRNDAKTCSGRCRQQLSIKNKANKPTALRTPLELEEALADEQVMEILKDIGAYRLAKMRKEAEMVAMAYSGEI